MNGTENPLLLREGGRGWPHTKPVTIAIIATALVVGAGMYLWHQNAMRALTAVLSRTSTSTKGFAQVTGNFSGLLSAAGATDTNGDASNDILAALKDGVYYSSVYGKSIKMPLGDSFVLEEKLIATGDLNGDGTPDVAAVLKETRGEHVFYGLAILMSWNGGYQNVGTALLGDREKVESVAIKNGAVEVWMLTHLPDDFIVQPTNPTIERFKLTDYGIAQF